MKSARFLLLLFLGNVFFACKNDNGKDTRYSGPPLFKLLNSEQTGIDFQNILDEGLNTNILVYEYFYNGGGIASGDFNNDGNTDLYFTSNMGPNKFYLNKGKMKFEDWTIQSGLEGRPGPWKTGVTTVDINSDGLLDIYLCYSGTLPAEKRTNQLFVNQGNDSNGIPVFKEQAADFGLNHVGYSTQAYFLDADLDHDLDMLLLNHNPKNLPLLNVEGTKALQSKDNPEMGLRYYKNNNGKYSDQTTSSGINGSELSYGLGLGISDFNQDGWPDFYVSNDYSVPDYLYINNQNGTFSNKLSEQIGHTSQFSMGNDVADYNNDGQVDIFTLDMLPEDNKRQKLLMAPDNFAKFDLNVKSGFYYQYMRNMMHRNNGDGTFSEIGQQLGISNTDWSWSPLLADFDNDGWKDLFISNGYYRDYTNLDFIKYMENYVQQRGRLQREDVLEIIKQMPSSNVVNYVFKNFNGEKFEKYSENWGLTEPSNSNGSVWVDLDNDGDLDLVSNNINKPAFIYQNQNNEQEKNNFLKIKLEGDPGNKPGFGAKVWIYAGSEMQYSENYISRGYQSNVDPVLNFGIGKKTSVDSIRVVWPGGKTQLLKNIKANQKLTIIASNATGDFLKNKINFSPIFKPKNNTIDFSDNSLEINDFERQLLITHQLSYDSPKMAKGDLNNDGLEDLIIGGASGQATSMFLQNESGDFKKVSVQAFDSDKSCQDGAIAIFDVNNDRLLDIFIASGGYHNFQPNAIQLLDRLYINKGSGNFEKSEVPLPKLFTSKSTLAIADINKDGLQDIFLGSRLTPGKYPLVPQSAVWINNNNGKFIDKTEQYLGENKNLGMVTDAVWADLDLDKSPELIVAGEFMPIRIFSVAGNTLEEKTDSFFEKKYKGFWNKLWIGDLNSDKMPDIIAGNTGRNIQLKASDSQPIELFYGDFDKNGQIDPILSSFIQNKKYPYVTRDELIYQLPKFRSEFTNFDLYSNLTTDELLLKLTDAQKMEVNTTETLMFINQKGGKFKVSQLPHEVQNAPVFEIISRDFDRDGKQDLVFFGNLTKTKLRLGQIDANYGLLLKGNGKGNFTYVPQLISGLKVKGDVRSVSLINNNLYIGILQKPMQVYHYE